jgi:hypothetical protein
MKALRAVLICLIVVGGSLVVLDLSGNVLIHDSKIGHTLVDHLSNPSDVARKNLDDATVDLQRRRLLQDAAIALFVFCLCAGVFSTTRAIRARTI